MRNGTGLISIGRFSQLARLSIKALRLYAEEGLLTPAYVDPDSGYRYYSVAQARQAVLIRMLRSLEMPLDEIRALLQAPDDGAVQVYLRRHQERISARIARDQHTLLLLQRLLEYEENLMSYPITVREIEPLPIAGIRLHTPPEAFAQAISETMGELMGYLGARGLLNREKPPLVLHHSYSEEDADIEVCVPVDNVIEGEGRVQSRVLEGGRAAYLLHTGPYEELGVIYPAFGTWMQEQSYEPAGPIREDYLNSPAEVKDPSQYRTEIFWPLQKVRVS